MTACPPSGQPGLGKLVVGSKEGYWSGPSGYLRNVGSYATQWFPQMTEFFFFPLSCNINNDHFSVEVRNLCMLRQTLLRSRLHLVWSKFFMPLGRLAETSNIILSCCADLTPGVCKVAGSMALSPECFQTATHLGLFLFDVELWGFFSLAARLNPHCFPWASF